jgi:hypothetical protein
LAVGGWRLGSWQLELKKNGLLRTPPGISFKKKRKQAPAKMDENAQEKFIVASMEKLKKTQALAQQMKEIQEQFKRETEEQDEMLKKFQQGSRWLWVQLQRA